MSEKSIKELQLEELQEAMGVPVDKKKPKEDMSGRPEDLEIASLYEDCWEYEQELEAFEKEFNAIKESSTIELVDVLIEAFPEEEKNFAAELKTVVETGWKQSVESGKYPKEQLEIIDSVEFGTIAKSLAEAFPSYAGDFEAEVKAILIKRWETYIEIKKEHIKEEVNYIKALGLKSHYAKRIYKRYHGIE